MKFLILLALFAAAVIAKDTYSGTCYYDHNTVYETGYSPRPMTNSEINQMITYGTSWGQYGAQMGRYSRGFDTMPVPPVLPCFCNNCQ